MAEKQRTEKQARDRAVKTPARRPFPLSSNVGERLWNPALQSILWHGFNRLWPRAASAD